MTRISNEADGERADQPRLFSAPPKRPSYRGSGLVFVLIVTVVIAVAAVRTTTDVRENLLPLQTFSRPGPTSSAAASTTPAASAATVKTPEPMIRVNVTPGGATSFKLELRGPCLFRALESGQELPGIGAAGEVEVTSTKTGLRIGTKIYAANQIEILPQSPPSIRVNGHLYRGKIRLFRRTDGQVSAVNVLPLEEYLASVVDSEMPLTFPDAARQAQAIVARTYALYQIEQADPKSVFDLMSSQRSQKYLGLEYRDKSGRRLAGESVSSRRVVAATRGVVCQSHGKLFCTYYSAVCGGQTTDGHAVFKDAADVIQSVSCDWCKDSPHYRWKSEISKHEFQRQMVGESRSSARPVTVRSVRQQSGPDDGTVTRFEFETGQTPVFITGAELRERLPAGVLSSPHFRIKLESDRVVFEGRGHGHGVGFCQWGAKGQAESGRNCQEIIRYYYPGVEIATRNY